MLLDRKNNFILSTPPIQQNNTMSGVRIVDREYYSFYRQFGKQMGIIIQTSYGLHLFTRAVLQVVGGGGGRRGGAGSSLSQGPLVPRVFHTLVHSLSLYAITM